MKDLIPQKEVKKIVQERRDSISLNDLRKKSRKVAQNLFETDELLSARNILTFASKIQGEVDTTYMIDLLIGMGKSVSLSQFNKSQNRYFRGVFLGWEKTRTSEDGFIESLVSVDDNFDDIDLVIIPSIAVNSNGKRIGYGNEYYTNLLTKTVAPKFALAFEFQVFKQFEILGDEISVEKIVTERRVLGNFN